PTDTGAVRRGNDAFGERTVLSDAGLVEFARIDGASIEAATSECVSLGSEVAGDDSVRNSICDSGSVCGMAGSPATLFAKSASNGERSAGRFFPRIPSTFAANFTGDPAEGFAPDENRGSPPGFLFQTGSPSGTGWAGGCWSATRCSARF